MDEFTEEKIIYSLLETIRNSEINDDERMTEGYLRNILYTFRADAIRNEQEYSEEIYQPYDLKFVKDSDNQFSANLTSILHLGRMGISITDEKGNVVPIASKEEALNAQRSHFHVPRYIGYIQNKKIVIIANLKAIQKADYLSGSLLNLLNEQNPVLEVSCVLATPSEGKLYDFKNTPFPMEPGKVNIMKQNILRKEFGIMYEVKKDEIQNARADNIIYQDESKLYK